MRINYGLTGGLNEEQLRKVHQTALRILDEIGVEVHSQEIPEDELYKIISSHSGVKIVDGRVCFSPSLVEKYLKEYQNELKSIPEETKQEITIFTPCHTFNILDPQTDEIRAHNTADLIKATELIDSFYEEEVRGGCPGLPCDIPKNLQHSMQYKISCEYSRSCPSVPIISIESAERIYEMAKVMGYASEDSYSVGFHPVSPLKLEGIEFDIALHFWKKMGSKISIAVGPMPIMGVTSPIFFPASLAQSIAEGLAGFVFFKLLTDGGKVSCWFNFYAFDMKYGNFSYGGPEDTLIALIRNQMSIWYGFPNNCGDKSLSTMSHAPDSQAAAEKSFKTITALLAGANRILNAGVLSLDETFSPEQLVIDVEIVNWAKRVSKGFDFTEESLGFNIIKEVISGKTDFLSHQTTLDNYRKTYWTPGLFEHLMKNQWKEKKCKSLREKAREIIKKKMAGDHFKLDHAKQKELDRIYKISEKELI